MGENKIGELKRLREEKGMTREELAARLKVSYMTIYRWEKDESSLHPVFEEKIRRILGSQKKEGAKE